MANDKSIFGSKGLKAGTYEVTNTSKATVVRLGTVFPKRKGDETTPVVVEVASPRDHLQLRACRALEVKPVSKKKGGGDSNPPGPADGNIDEVMDRVDGDPDKAREALEAEQAKSDPRSTLVEQLQAVIDGDGADE